MLIIHVHYYHMNNLTCILEFSLGNIAVQQARTVQSVNDVDIILRSAKTLTNLSKVLELRVVGS